MFNGDDVLTEDDGWLDFTAKDILSVTSGAEVKVVSGEMMTEEAVEVSALLGKADDVDLDQGRSPMLVSGEAYEPGHIWVLRRTYSDRTR